MNRADLHFHVLPGVDDGPVDLAAALALAADAVADGTSVAVATPHVRGGYVQDVSELPGRVAELQAALDRERIKLTLRVGAEVGHDMIGRLSQADLDLVAQGPPGARWILLEAPFAGIDAEFHDAADEVRSRGFGVLIAHPERAKPCPVGIRRELVFGSALQVNVWSLAGRHGEGARLTGLGLVRERYAAVVSSDAHGDWRRPLLSRALTDLEIAGIDPALARGVTASGPRRLLETGLRAPRLAPAAA